MDWKKMKKILIIIFTGINMVLFLYNNYIMTSRYTLSAEDKMILQQVFEANDINIYATLPQFKPMSNLRLKESSFNKMKFANKIRKKDVNFPYVEGISTYTNDITGESITFLDSENKIVYENSKGKYEGAKDYKTAKDVATQFANWFLEDDYDLSLSTQVEVEKNRYKITFVEVFKEEYKIFSNNLSVTITNQGVVRAEFVRLLPLELVNPRWEITPVDDVLYNVLNYIRQSTPDNSIHIRDIDIGYRVDYGLMGDERTANPYYFIYYIIDNKDGREVEEKVLYINAYNNEFIKEN